MPDVLKIPIFSGSLKKLLGEISSPVSRELLKLTTFVNPDDWLKECACQDCKRELAEKNAGAAIFNQACGMNYFSYREKEGMVSYLPDGKKLEELAGGGWGRKCRQEIAPGKWAQRILTTSLNQKDLKEFTDIFLRKEAEERISIHMVDPQEAYNANIKSCMKGCEVGPFYNLFGCKAVIAKQHGQICARALVWENVERPRDEVIGSSTTDHVGTNLITTLMDRTYPNEGPLAQALFEYAASQNWWRKTAQSAGTTGVVHPALGDACCAEWKVRNLYPELTKHNPMKAQGGLRMFSPYLDTFPRSDKDLTYLTPKTVPAGWVYTNQNGQRSRDKTGLVQCAETSLYIEREVAVMYDGLFYAPWVLFKCSFTGEQFPRSRGYRIIHQTTPDGEPMYVASCALGNIPLGEDETDEENQD